MKVAGSILKSLDMAAAAKEVTAGSAVQRLPPLSFYHCMNDAQESLVEAARAMYIEGRSPAAETITMPRRGFGPRPVTLLSPIDHVVYSSLVSRIVAASGVPDRSADEWMAFEGFGRAEPVDPKYKYLVEIDIASCYEYIDHLDLRSELISLTLDVDAAQALVELLTSIYPRGRGLPQLHLSSDRLAEIYLSVIERSLLRRGYPAKRYADDFRILAETWPQANQAIEDAADAARELGLILSTEKTRIIRIDTLRDQADADNLFLARHFGAKPTVEEFLASPYGPDLVEDDTDDDDDDDGVEGVEDVAADQPVSERDAGPDDSLHRGALSIIEEWVQGVRRQGEPHLLGSKWLPGAVSLLADASVRISDENLQEIVFRIPMSLEPVVNYLRKRPSELDANWATLQMLSSMGRQSPWAKIWLLYLARHLSVLKSASRTDVLEWAEGQAWDSHEVVRCQAIWTIAHQDNRDVKGLVSAAYGPASSLTRAGIAAAAGAGEIAENDPLARAIRSDSKLSKAAFEWGKSH
ncbi:RNA-directed DNA polymerase [Pseudonocardia pini]|uniref:RNA-directed DNA polymerase n=1 Tax=Pseudonocardia pini TaxID=2758030 RepID=UPI0015F01DB8|nr:RNA-directed DNA polymerase [Pseudonocardia pini]